MIVEILTPNCAVDNNQNSEMLQINSEKDKKER